MRTSLSVTCSLLGAFCLGGCAGTDYSDGLDAHDVGVAQVRAAGDGIGCPDPALKAGDTDAAGAAPAGRSGIAIVTGAVANPGAVPLGEGARTLAAVLAEAGAGSAETPLADVRLLRGGRLYDFEYFAAGCAVRPADIVVADGDLVRIPKADETYVTLIGEVGQQGRIKVPPGGMTVLEAIAQARGTNNVTAQRDVVYLVRRDGQGARALRLSAADMLNNLANPLPVRHNDVIVVPPSKLAQWDRFWRQLLSFLGPAVDKAAGVP